VKGADGQTHKFTKEEVVSVEKGSAGGAPPTAGAGTPGTVGGTAKPAVAVNFNATKSKCNTVESALAAVTLWQQFLDNAPPNSPDLPAAREELKRWKALADGGAEKIKGKWPRPPSCRRRPTS
jgi:hypothetical protein